MFTELYLHSTDPTICLERMIRENSGLLILSILFHTIIYSSFINLVSFIFLGKILSTMINIRLVIALLIIMSFGYIGRFYHVKDIYKAYGENIEKAREHIDKFFISWVFIG
jgi:hypothetical protein